MLLAVKNKRDWCVSIRLLLVKLLVTHPDDHNLPNYDMTPGFKPFTDTNTVYNATVCVDFAILYPPNVAAADFRVKTVNCIPYIHLTQWN